MRVILLGPPGAGKGTQAARLAESLNIPHTASGDLFRDHQKRDTELGRLARSYMDRGVLVPDDVTIRMIIQWIDDNVGQEGFLLDGFPRTLAQAGALDKKLDGVGGVDRVLYVKVPNDELVKRLNGRLTCRDCQVTYHRDFNPPPEGGECGNCGEDQLYQREDDLLEAVNHRLEVYFSETEPLIDYYEKQGSLRAIDGGQSINEVGRALRGAVE